MTDRPEALQWWADHPDATAVEVADHFGVKPTTVRQWKRRHGLPDPSPTTTSSETPEPAAVWAPLDSLHPWPDNPRVNEHAVPAVARSLARFGFGKASFVGWQQNGARRIVAGHTTRLAVLHLLEQRPVYDFQCAAVSNVLLCKSCRAPTGDAHAEDCYTAAIPFAPLGMVPIRWRDDWTEEEAAGYAIADNKLGELADWAPDPLAEQLRALAEHDIDHALLGFDDGLSLDSVIADLMPDADPVVVDPDLGGAPVPQQTRRKCEACDGRGYFVDGEG